ncbi:TonB-dependent receptor [Novosphingobium sp. PP1Y]|uniref:TonB-dependent receptor n=1 Tax=Novosphingobium sp. PP1Y TaxID=702113 RepID=UPI00020EFB0D|nr:TonB-dependent receptor [Novosphingobium sp. PP1Y]CCA90598.1 TonB-dependent receptor [Novosphingobium sp. PP1Y]
MSRKTLRLLPSGFALAIALTSVPALAQATDEDSDHPNGEIVVTAAKRSENLQDVPISISAISGNALAASRTNSVDDLVTKVANLQLTSIVGDNTPIFALRGVSMSDYSLNQSSPVATYYDEVYKGNFAFLGVAMYDLERVEVLRGPQGTLYGKNTTGGAVNIISRTAKLGETTGYVNLGYGNYNRMEASGAVNAPLGDNAAIRLAGTFARADGWFKNVVPGMPDLASTREYGLRGSILFEPTDTVRFTLRASTSYQNPRNYGIYAQPEDINRPGLSKFEIASNIAQRRRARTYSVALTTDIDVSDTLGITSVTSWDKGKLSFYEDTDGTASQLLEIPYYDRASQFAQDLRLTSDTGGPFDFILGAYFNREKVFNRTTFEIGKDIDLTGDNTVTVDDCVEGLTNADPTDDGIACLFRNSFTQVKKSYALYTDLKYELSSAITLRGGLRYTHDTGKQSEFQADALGVDESLVATLIPTSSLSYKTDNLSGKIGFDYNLADGNIIYISVSRGFRAPSFNAQAFFDPSELSVAKAEKVTSYELGAKTQFAGRSITLNMAAFYYDYRNQQFINVDPSTAAQTLLNFPKSRIYGAEAELTVRANDMISIHSGVGLLSSKIIDGTVSGTVVDGNRLSNAPSLTFNASLDLAIMDNDTGKLSLHPEMAYQSSQYFEVINVPRLQQSGYAILGAHLDFETADGRWTASIWGKNLTNKLYFTSRVDLLAGFGFDYNHIGTPRTYGASVGMKF